MLGPSFELEWKRSYCGRLLAHMELWRFLVFRPGCCAHWLWGFARRHVHSLQDLRCGHWGPSLLPKQVLHDCFVKVVELVAIDGIGVRQDITELLPSFNWQLAGQLLLDYYSSSEPLAPNSKSSSNSQGSRVLAYLKKAKKCPECSHPVVETAIAITTFEVIVDCLHLIPTLGYYSALFLA